MKTKYTPYGFDEKYEYKTYKNIGKDYGDRKIADVGFFENVKRYFRRKTNRKQKQYAMYNTYEQWKKHVKKNIERYPLSIENYKHWLIKQQRYYQERLELIKIILIPLYIFMLTVLAEQEKSSIQLLYATILAETMMCLLVMNDTKKSLFYKDYIEIMDEKENK